MLCTWHICLDSVRPSVESTGCKEVGAADVWVEQFRKRDQHYALAKAVNSAACNVCCLWLCAASVAACCSCGIVEEHDTLGRLRSD